MLILYDSFLAVLLIALTSFTVTQLLYFKGDEGYVIGPNAPAIALGWIGCIPIIMYQKFSEFLNAAQRMQLIGILLILASYIIYRYYMRLIQLKSGISLVRYIKNFFIVAILVSGFAFLNYNTYLLKNILTVVASVSGLVLISTQTKLYKNEINSLWCIFLITGEVILLIAMWIELSVINNRMFILQSMGVVIYGMGLALNFFDTSVRTADKKISELEQQNRRLFEAEVQVLKYAYKDQITNLPNYSSFHSSLTNLLNSKSANTAYLLYLDLDDFRRVNTVVGFAEGNEILKASGIVISEVLPSRDKLFRINGSRFALIHFGSMDSSKKLAKTIIEVVNETEGLRTNNYFKQGISIGITEVDNQKDFNTIVNQAEIAMYKVKEYRKNDYEYFNELHEREYKNLLELEGKLKNATKDNVWTVYLQPQVSVDSNEVLGLEALIRWFDGERFIPPNEFIPLAEKNGLIISIGDDVIQKVFALMRDCRYKYNCNLKFSINISAVEIFDKSFVSRMKSYIEEYEVDPADVTLELTETAILENVDEAQAILTELRDMKLSISIDDFGSGYTSLYYLSKLPIDEVKIDKSFIDNILINEKDKIMLGHFTNLCHDLGLNVVAEGVETKEQLDYVKGIGCDLYQGYYFSKPMSYENIISSFDKKTVSQSS